MRIRLAVPAVPSTTMAMSRVPGLTWETDIPNHVKPSHIMTRASRKFGVASPRNPTVVAT